MDEIFNTCGCQFFSLFVNKCKARFAYTAAILASYSHFNAWKIDKYDFIKDVEKGYQTLEKNGIKSILFRPPHGKLKNLHLQKFKSKYKIINWSLMPGDFDLSISKTTCLNRLKKIKSGDIVVLHDNEKSWKHLHYCLPLFLEFCDENNFQCVVLEH